VPWEPGKYAAFPRRLYRPHFQRCTRPRTLPEFCPPGPSAHRSGYSRHATVPASCGRLQCEKNLDVEALVAQSSVDADDLAVLDRTSRPDKVQLEVVRSPGCPVCGLVFVTGGAGVRNARLLRFFRRDETEGVGAHEVVLDCLLDFGHVACDALAASASFCMVGVFAHRPFEPCGVVLRVARQADSVAHCIQIGDVLIAVYLMAIKAANLPVVHNALDEVVALHSVLVRREIGVLIEIGCSRFQFFELPVIGQPSARQKADRPVVIFARDRIAERLPLAMALDTGVISAHVIEGLRINDVLLRRMSDVQATRTVAFLEAYISFRYMLGLYVVVDRVTPVACRSARGDQSWWDRRRAPTNPCLPQRDTEATCLFLHPTVPGVGNNRPLAS